MKKINNKGFVLAETLIVTVFVVALFSIVFMNFYPLIGEYDRRENYDDVDSKYGAYWVKKMIQDSPSIKISANHGFTLVKYSSFREVFCSKLNDDGSNDDYKGIFNEDVTKRNICENLVSKLNIQHMYISAYNLSVFKEAIADYGNLDSSQTTYGISTLSQGFKDYVNYLPKYTYPSLNGAKFRVLVEFKKTFTNSENKQEDYYTYATMEVIK